MSLYTEVKIHDPRYRKGFFRRVTFEGKYGRERALKFAKTTNDDCIIVTYDDGVPSDPVFITLKRWNSEFKNLSPFGQVIEVEAS